MAHRLWRELQYSAPPLVQHTAIPALHRAKEIARLVARPHLPLYEVKGRNEAGPLTVTYGGLGYARPLLESLLFTQRFGEKEIGRISTWRAGGLTSASGSDLIIIESSKHLVQHLPRLGAIVQPYRLQFVLDLSGQWDQIEQGFRPQTRRRIHKQRRTAGFECEISQRRDDLKMFYEDMYLPTVQQRHGELAAILPEQEAFQLLRHGRLFLVRRGEEYVCGSLILARQGILESVEMGVLNGSSELMKQGVVDTMHYLCIHWAYQERWPAFSLGDCWPYLSGNFYSKHKWGTVVSIPRHEHKQIWIRIQQDTPAVRQFLTRNPCVIVDGRGCLRPLLVTDHRGGNPPETLATEYRLYETPGLHSPCICAVSDLMERDSL